MNPKQTTHKQKNALAGVTLIEMMVTIAVLAIVIGIGAPSFGELILQNRLSSAANDILSGVAFTRSEAIKRNSSRRFCLNSATLTWDQRTIADPHELSRVGTVSAGIAVLANNLGAEYTDNLICLDYHSDGLPYEPFSATASSSNLITNGSLALTLGSTTKTVHIKTGSVYVK